MRNPHPRPVPPLAALGKNTTEIPHGVELKVRLKVLGLTARSVIASIVGDSF